MEPSSVAKAGPYVRRCRHCAVGLASATCIVLLSQSQSGFAQGLIRHPGEHIDYSVELEPHAAFGPFDPPGNTYGTGLGLGMRATIPIMKNGFVSTINNSVGVSFGFDWLHYSGQDVTVGPCARWVAGPNNTLICVQVAGPGVGPANYVFLPVAMQWNFWLHEKFSVFGEPGMVIYYRKPAYFENSGVGLAPMLDVGGRWHFARPAALTFRFGYPVFSLGVSFFL